ncbi:hypothetical protein, partial [Pyramidobacter piscolens]|uniref:hypothetical protein n=1 Tax=Pyramidobacter piscolens TaxID=638849 RepID=UPI001E2CF539
LPSPEPGTVGRSSIFFVLVILVFVKKTQFLRPFITPKARRKLDQIACCMLFAARSPAERFSMMLFY